MTRHVPVLLEETIDSLQLKSGINVIDCTLGDGGHSERILEQTGPDGKLLGIDTDTESLLRAKQHLYRFEDRVIFVRDNFTNLKKIVEESKLKDIKGILMDFGWSSPQFADRGRGFSFQKDEELDMRYDPSSDSVSAREIVNSYSEYELEKIFREYGEEKFSKKIAKKIIEKRKIKEIVSTNDLVNVVTEVIKNKAEKIHPATRVFQALRIAVNDELGVIKSVLPDAVELLSSGGRLAVITFHSLEDRIVKHFFKGQENKTLKLIIKKPITCSDKECKENPRSRSAKLRVIEKI